MFKVLRQLQYFRRTKLNTQVYSKFTDKQMSTPELMKKVILKPIHMHSRVSQRSLFHGKRVRHAIKSCFSQKKTKIYKRVNKIKKYMYSDILKKRLYVTFSSKAYRCMKKLGSFDYYILLTRPTLLDSKYGQYLRELMLRKINDPQWKIPYVIGEGRKKNITHYKRHMQLGIQRKKYQIPRQIKEKLYTFQRQFGTRPDQLNQEYYAKYVQLKTMKQQLGSQFDTNHPLIDELKEKMKNRHTIQDPQQIQKMAKKAEQDYLNRPGPPAHKQYRRLKVQKAKRTLKQYAQKFQDLQTQKKVA